MQTKPNYLTFISAFCLLFNVLISYPSNAQRNELELTFTSIEINNHVQLDSIKVINRTQSSMNSQIDTMLYWPDTVLNLYFVEIPEINKIDNTFQVFQNYPNPVSDATKISLFVPEKDHVDILITNLLGQVILKSDRVLHKGIHTFRFTPGGGNFFLFTCHWRGNVKSVKIFQPISQTNRLSSLEYLGTEMALSQYKSEKINQNFSFNLGDELLFIGYTNTLQSGMLDIPEESKNYTFQFAINIPCLGIPSINYEGQEYNTIQIFSQCWLKENLNIGTMIQGDEEMTDNNIIEKYCYNNELDSCAIYGGLYQWQEMMQYASGSGLQGICPPGWHLPTNEEWMLLEGAVDSLYDIGDIEWEFRGNRGYDASTNLKTNYGWYNGSNGSDLFGFSGLPGGKNYYGTFLDVYKEGFWWSSTEGDGFGTFMRALPYHDLGIFMDAYAYRFGFSVRCILNE